MINIDAYAINLILQLYPVNEIDPMQEKRRYHGITSINVTIFVFGSLDASRDELKTCKEFENGKWIGKKTIMSRWIYIYI